MIAPDRPGIGLSDPSPHFSYIDWPADVLQVADHLGLRRFAVAGLSGGAPFALACAYQVPERLTACGIISPLGPFVREGRSRGSRMAWWMVANTPWLARGLAYLFSPLAHTDPESIERSLLARHSKSIEPDGVLMQDPNFRARFVRGCVEAYRQGARSPVKDALVYRRPWGFSVENVNFDQVLLWQGERDRTLLPAGARRLAQGPPSLQSHLLSR